MISKRLKVLVIGIHNILIESCIDFIDFKVHQAHYLLNKALFDSYLELHIFYS